MQRADANKPDASDDKHPLRSANFNFFLFFRDLAERADRLKERIMAVAPMRSVKNNARQLPALRVIGEASGDLRVCLIKD